jgi:hypothetical protein
MNRKYHCPLLIREIEEGKCVDINYELIKAKKEEELKELRKLIKMTNAEIESICQGCPNYPL